MYILTGYRMPPHCMSWQAIGCSSYTHILSPKPGQNLLFSHFSNVLWRIWCKSDKKWAENDYFLSLFSNSGWHKNTSLVIGRWVLKFVLLLISCYTVKPKCPKCGLNPQMRINLGKYHKDIYNSDNGQIWKNYSVKLGGQLYILTAHSLF